MIEGTTLTIKQDQFCQEYLVDLNGTQAAIRAGYSSKGAGVQAGKLLELPKIAARIQEYMDKRAARTEITADNVLKELSKIAFVSVDDFYKDDGSVKLLSELSPHVRSALASYSIKTIYVGSGEDKEAIDIPQFKAHDKVKTLEMLGKHFAMFEGKEADKGPKVQGKRVTIARRSDKGKK